MFLAIPKSFIVVSVMLDSLIFPASNSFHGQKLQQQTKRITVGFMVLLLRFRTPAAFCKILGNAYTKISWLNHYQFPPKVLDYQTLLLPAVSRLDNFRKRDGYTGLWHQPIWCPIYVIKNGSAAREVCHPGSVSASCEPQMCRKSCSLGLCLSRDRVFRRRTWHCEMSFPR